ncbi:MAG: tryptophan synthase subunit alpha [Bacteroidales bacterium]|nr:tryptophan synthase subunit alpha [Bacteroidales bacterium]
MNRIDRLFRTKNTGILSVYFTAGYPSPGSTTDIIISLAGAGADMVEIGIPFSDPLADGPVIQNSSSVAIRNGMSLKLLFSQIERIREKVDIPLLLMGYLNPVLKFGMENFCRKCAETGIDGVILPDLPPEMYDEQYRPLFRQYNLFNILLVSPLTDSERAGYIDSITDGFIYMVSSSSVTGVKPGFSGEQKSYFQRMVSLNLSHPLLIGFGISSPETFREACLYGNGAITGSAFIKMLEKEGFNEKNIIQFVQDFKRKL